MAKNNSMLVCVLMTSAAALTACGTSDEPSEMVTGYSIVRTDGASMNAVMGDSLALSVVETLSDGKQHALPPGAVVTWTAPAAVTALPSDSTAEDPMPNFSAGPAALFIDNALRPDRAANLHSVLFVVGASATNSGSLGIAATIGGAVTGTATATIPVVSGPIGDTAHGATVYQMACGGCHGATGAGTAANPDGTFSYAGGTFDYPAPGLNGADGNLASDPSWSPSLLAMSARADVDNCGLVLRRPMPDWLSTPVEGHLLTDQDFADMFAFLATQTE